MARRTWLGPGCEDGSAHKEGRRENRLVCDHTAAFHLLTSPLCRPHAGSPPRLIQSGILMPESIQRDKGGLSDLQLQTAVLRSAAKMNQTEPSQ